MHANRIKRYHNYFFIVFETYTDITLSCINLILIKNKGGMNCYHDYFNKKKTQIIKLDYDSFISLFNTCLYLKSIFFRDHFYKDKNPFIFFKVLND